MHAQALSSVHLISFSNMTMISLFGVELEIVHAYNTQAMLLL